MSWTIEVQAQDNALPGDACVVEVDPRRRQVWLGVRAVGAGSAEVGNRAIARRVLGEGQTDWGPAAAWLRGPEAGPLLERIEAGYSADRTWSGDVVGQWTEDAWDAAAELTAQVQTRTLGLRTFR